MYVCMYVMYVCMNVQPWHVPVDLDTPTCVHTSTCMCTYMLLHTPHYVHLCAHIKIKVTGTSIFPLKIQFFPSGSWQRIWNQCTVTTCWPFWRTWTQQQQIITFKRRRIPCFYLFSATRWLTTHAADLCSSFCGPRPFRRGVDPTLGGRLVSPFLLLFLQSSRAFHTFLIRP